MDTLTAIENRHSTRSYAARPLPRQILEKIIDAGRHAPTARNEQPWEFVVVTDSAMRRQIAELTDHGRFLAEAAACVAVFCRDTKYFLEDGCAASENVLLAATSLGVQSCWIAGDKKAYTQSVATLLEVPPGYKLVSLLALGYAAAAEKPKAGKRPLQQVVHWEKF